MLITHSFLHFIVVACAVSTLASVTPRSVQKCPYSRLADNQDCIPYVVDKEIAGIKLSIYSWTDPKSPTTALASSQYLQPLQNVAAKILPVYGRYMETKVNSVRIYLTKDPGDPDRGVTDFQNPDKSVCSIKIIGNADGSDNSDIYSVQQTLAHELYHCVQRTFDEHKPDRSNVWWYESSAEYFANVYYPNTKPDHMQYYCPSSPLFLQASSGGYASSLFFQHLSNTFTPDIAIHNWVVSRIKAPSHDLQQEQMMLSSDHFINKAFPSFTTQFVDGAIRYIDDEPVVSIRTKCKTPDLVTETVTYTLPKGAGCYHTELLGVTPWRIYNELIATFPANRLISFSFTTQSGDDTVLQYRKTGDEAWKQIKQGKQGSVDMNDKDTEYAFLASSTSNADIKTVFDVGIDFTVKMPPHNRKAKRDLGLRHSNLKRLGYNSSMILAEEPTAGDSDKQKEMSKRQERDDDSCDITSCPYGGWSFTADLEIDGIKESTPGGVTVSDIAVTGSGTFTLDQATMIVTLKFDSFSQAFTDTSPSSDGTEDISVHYDLAIDGGGTATAVFAADGKSFKLANPTFSGTFASETTYNDGDAMGPTGDFAVGFGPGVPIEFACDNVATDGDDHMSLNGLFGGNFIYDLFFQPDESTT